MEEYIKKRIDEWTTSPEYDRETQAEIQALVSAGDEKELIDRFYQDLEFGTGGLRGILGAGTNRMNIYNVLKVTQGLANYIVKMNGQEKGIVIGRDSRIKSDVFAETVAGVMVANGIRVYYYDDIHPTPTVSFGIRYYQTMAGVMVTASHNPQEYNGYKVFWDDGAQVTPPHDTNIIDEVKKIAELSQVKTVEFEEVKKSDLFKIIDQEIDPVYLEKTLNLSIHPEVIPASGVKICYSPLHGVGYKLVPKSLKNYGFTDITLVKEQSEPDGRFPTAPYPNPEFREAMELGIETSKKTGADVFIATDPDADRIGVALRQADGDYLLLNGNQIATLLVYYKISELSNSGKMPPKPFMVSTIVTTPILEKIAESFHVQYFETLTGFKWIASKTAEMLDKGGTFIYGLEESHGYNAADYVRDKDAVNAASLFAELTAFYKSKGLSVAEQLDKIYEQYGYYKESQIAKKYAGREGVEKIQSIMNTLRVDTPKSIGDFQVLTKFDTYTDEVIDIQSGKKTGNTGLPKSNVIVLNLSGGQRVIARPSGTEPKIKFYFSSNATPDGKSPEQLKQDVADTHEKIRDLFLKTLGIVD